MCLVGIAFRVNADYPIILAGNRDEYHARPSAAADWWQDKAHLLGGRDLQAGGSWLAANDEAHVAVVTNRPDLPPPDTDALSRGELVTGALSPAEFSLEDLEPAHDRYGGFSLLLANRERLSLFSGGHGTGFKQAEMPAGIIAVSNTAIDQPWPKVSWLEQELDRIAGQPEPDPAAILALLTRREPVPNAASHGVPATPFVVGDEYGTRCCTVVIARADGQLRFVEHRFGPAGIPAGEAEFVYSSQG